MEHLPYEGQSQRQMCLLPGPSNPSLLSKEIQKSTPKAFELENGLRHFNKCLLTLNYDIPSNMLLLGSEVDALKCAALEFRPSP